MKQTLCKLSLPVFGMLMIATGACVGSSATPPESATPMATTIPAPTGAPAWTMTFLASPAIAIPGYGEYPHVVYVRSGDTMNVIVHQPVACGERLRDGSFEVESKWLLLRYSAPYEGAWNGPCISTGMFVFHGLPSGDIQVVALPEPLPIAAASAPSEASSMGFLASPAIAVPAYPSYPHVVRVRSGDVTNVIVHQPVACGERLRDASFEREGEFLLLRYSAPYEGAWNSPCVSTGMFTFHGLPSSDIQFVALPDPVPVEAVAINADAHPLRLGFLASPAIAVSGYAVYPDVVAVHNGDTENVIVHQPCACGERLRDASFEREGEFLLLRYSAPYEGAWNSPCVSTGMFVIRGLSPGEEVRVVALPEPLVVVAHR